MKATKNKICIFLVTYNRKKYLKYALESVLNQSYGDFTLTILDNCSTDGTKEYVESILDQRIKYIRHEKNIGGLANIAYAFEHSEGEYFAVFHDDDILHSTLIEEEITYLEDHDECVAVSCLSNNIDENGNLINLINESKNKERKFTGNEFFTEYLNHQRSFTFPATMYRTSFIKNNFINIRSEPGPCFDVVLYMDIGKCGGTIVEIPKVLFDFRITKTQMSTTYLEDMLVKLIHYLSCNDYYRTLLMADHTGRTRFFKWYFRRLLARIISNCVNYGDAVKYLELIFYELDRPVENIKRYKKILKFSADYSGLSMLAYKTIKKVKYRI